MTRHYSALSLLKEGLNGQCGWQKAWRSPQPRPRYDVLIGGGGGHGLATAYYLAKNHGVHNVAVVEKGWIGGGNTGRNTTIVRSNYFFPESVALYDLALRLYEGLSRELNYNITLSQRGVLTTAFSLPLLRAAQRERVPFRRRLRQRAAGTAGRRHRNLDRLPLFPQQPARRPQRGLDAHDLQRAVPHGPRHRHPPRRGFDRPPARRRACGVLRPAAQRSTARPG